MNDYAKLFGMILAVIAGCAIGIILHAYAICMLWSWFVTPIFGLPPLSIMQAIGLGLFLAYFLYRHVDYEEEEPAKILGMVYFRPLFFLILGWVVSRFL